MAKVSLRYFRASAGNGTRSIESMTREAVGAVGARWKDREWTNDDYDPPKILLANHLRPSRHNVFGDLLAMRPETIDLIIDTSDDRVSEAATQRLSLSNATALIRSSLFWLVEDQHVVICSSGLQSTAFEHYFTWLLKNRGLGNHAIKLNAAVNVSAEDLRTIKSISLGDHLIIHPGPKSQKRADRAKEDVETMTGSDRTAKLREILKAVAGSAAQADKVINRVPVDQKVAWKFQMSFQRPDPEASRAALEEAYRVSTQAEATEISVNTASGKIRGEDFLLVEQAEIRQRSDGLLDRDEVLGAMQAALEHWKATERI